MLAAGPDEERDACAVAGFRPEPRSDVRGDVRTDREERHVAQVEQPGEAHDHVQAQRHHHVGRRKDHVLERRAELAEEEREDRRETEARRGEHRPRDSRRPVNARADGGVRPGVSAHLAEGRRRR
jgi:hypothetical protein